MRQAPESGARLAHLHKHLPHELPPHKLWAAPSLVVVETEVPN